MLKRVFKIIGILALLFAFFFASILAYFIVRTNHVRLDQSKLTSSDSQVVFYDDDNQALQNTSGENRSMIAFDQLPAHTIHAFCVAEDKNFFTHQGLEIKRMIKASFKNIFSFSFKEGASTITQQLIKNTQLTPEKTLLRKFKEIRLSLQLEKEYSKQEIFEMYLNHIYFGKSAYGIESAANLYFSQSASSLSIGQSCMLAALIKSPQLYSPIVHADKCLARRNLILKLMKQEGYLTDDQYHAEFNKDLELNLQQTHSNADYIDAAIKEASDILKLNDKDFSTGGYRIYTYLNQNLNRYANALINTKAYYLNNTFPKTMSAIALCDNNTLGMQVFVAKNIPSLYTFRRQIGSAIKPLYVYAPALEKNFMTPATLLDDNKIEFGDYSPTNFDGKYHGLVSVRYALSHSLNIPAVKVLSGVGTGYCQNFTNRMGITVEENSLTAALGSTSMPIALTNILGGYVTLANSGKYSPPTFIRQIQNANGITLYEHHPEKVPVMRDDTAFLTTDMLKDSVTNGTASKLNCLNIPIAAKTGTVGSPAGNSDTYTFSYTTAHTLMSYMGNDNLLPNEMTGGSYTAMLSRDFYRQLYQKNIPSNFSIPTSVVRAEIDKKSLDESQRLQLATTDTPKKYMMSEWFSKSNLPLETSDYFIMPKVCCAEIKIKERYPHIHFVAQPEFEYHIIDHSTGKILHTITNAHHTIDIPLKNLPGGKLIELEIRPLFRAVSGKIYEGKSYIQKIMCPLDLTPTNPKDDSPQTDHQPNGENRPQQPPNDTEIDDWWLALN